MNRVAVVILNWNGQQFLEIFLKMVIQRSQGATIVVADNGSNDNSVAYLRENFADQIQIMTLDANYGYTGGYNRALQQLDNEYVVLLNSDIEPAENWLEPLVATMDENPRAAAVQPKIRSFGDKVRFEYAGASGGFIDTLGYPFCRGRFVGNTCEVDKGQYDTARECFWATGAAMMVRTNVFKESGGLDDNFFAHMEEIDLCWRFKRAGWKIMVAPESVVYHVGGGTLPVWSSHKTYLNFRNNIAMLYKNLSLWRFLLVYFVRMGTDFLRLASYLLSSQWNFAAAIFRGHRDFWRMRKKLNRHNELGHRAVGQIYKGSIILRQILRSKKFGNMMNSSLILLMLLASCGSPAPKAQKIETEQVKTSIERPKSPIEMVKINIVKKYPHAADAYTQGLLWHDGKLYESTGEYGHSSLRKVDLNSGKIEKKVDLSDTFFGEGLAMFGGQLYQLTWMEQTAFVYDPNTFTVKKKVGYNGEGWGITNDSTTLYVSDGSNKITLYNPDNFLPVSTIEVYDDRGPVTQLNELEWIEGKIWANIYMTNLVAIIDPSTGNVEQYIDCSELEKTIGNPRKADVLNGIAYDKTTKRIFMTGKKWDTLFEVTTK